MNYKEFNYICIDPIIAEIKQELKSYFEAGALSDIMIPTYVDQALRKLKHIPLKPEFAILFVSNYKTILPDDFYLINWATTYEIVDVPYGTIPKLDSYFYKAISCTGSCNDCFDSESTFEVYEQIQIPSLTTNQNIHLHSPRPLKIYFGSKEFCTEDCPNIKPLYRVHDTMYINDNRRVTTNFTSGCIGISYVARPLDENNIPMIPEQLEIEEYVKAHIKFKLFEQLFHSVVDETFNQIEKKFNYYKQDSLNKLQSARATNLIDTQQQLNDSIAKRNNRFRKFHIR